jgi:hypothetical protein
MYDGASLIHFVTPCGPLGALVVENVGKNENLLKNSIEMMQTSRVYHACKGVYIKLLKSACMYGFTS